MITVHYKQRWSGKHRGVMAAWQPDLRNSSYSVTKSSTNDPGSFFSLLFKYILKLFMKPSKRNKVFYFPLSLVLSVFYGANPKQNEQLKHYQSLSCEKHQFKKVQLKKKGSNIFLNLQKKIFSPKP